MVNLLLSCLGILLFGLSLFLLRTKIKQSKEVKSLKQIVSSQTDQLNSLQSQLQTATTEKKFLTDFVKHSGEALVCIDSEEKLVLINPAAERLLGMSQADLLTKPYKDLVQLKVNNTQDYSLIERSFKGEYAAIPDEMVLVSRAGTFYIGGFVSPIKEESGQVIGSTILFWDSTKTREKEQQYKSMVTTAAHNIRTPLAIIKAGIGLLVEQRANLSPDQIGETLASTGPAIAQLEAQVNDFLNIARIEQGRVTISKEPFDILEVVQSVIAVFEPTAKEKHLYLRYEKDGTSIPKVIGDKNKTREIMTNLISNALKYTRQGGITITHEVKDTLVLTRVADTGVGIPADYQSLLFKTFSQVGKARASDTATSTGLGLFISKQFAHLSGGDLILEQSEATKGSTFALTLPKA